MVLELIEGASLRTWAGEGSGTAPHPRRPRAGGTRAASSPRRGHRPPRHQTREHHGDAGSSDRARRRLWLGRAARGYLPVLGVGHARVHVPGAARRRPDRRALGSVRVLCDRVRGPHRSNARLAESARNTCGRGSPAASSRGRPTSRPPRRFSAADSRPIRVNGTPRWASCWPPWRPSWFRAAGGGPSWWGSPSRPVRSSRPLTRRPPPATGPASASPRTGRRPAPGSTAPSPTPSATTLGSPRARSSRGSTPSRETGSTHAARPARCRMLGVGKPRCSASNIVALASTRSSPRCSRGTRWSTEQPLRPGSPTSSHAWTIRSHAAGPCPSMHNSPPR